METKLAKLKAALATGDHVGALRIAAKVPQLGDEKADITRAWGAIQNPDFFRQLGKDPERLIELGVLALRRRYKIV
jgi:hypothetical protein